MRYRLIVPAYVNEQIDTCIAYIAQTLCNPDAQASIIDEQRASLALKRAAARLQTAKTVKPGA